MPDSSIFTTYDISTGYRSAHFTKKLRRKETNTIGVIVPQLDSYFVTSVLKGIAETTSELGFELIVANSQECAEKEAANTRMLCDAKVDGVIASLSCRTMDASHFTLFKAKGVPVVFFDRVAGADNGDKVVIDNAGCGFLATEHLVKQGCNRIAIIMSDLEKNVYAQRYQGYRLALEKYKIPFSNELLIFQEPDKEAGGNAARLIRQMSVMPDGLFFTNDLAAAVCMHSLEEAGIRIPEDIAVVGFNNDPIGRLITPTLTTIDYPGYEIGKKAVANLLDRLTGNGTRIQRKTTVIPSGLIVRQSSLKRTHATA